jgi:protein-disulfide isomerase
MKPILHLLMTTLCLGFANLAVCGQESGDLVVATINESRQIRLREVDDAARGEILKYEQQIYRLRQQAIEHLIDRLLIEEEAARRGIPPLELIRSLVPVEVAIESAQLEKANAEYLPALQHLGEIEGRLRIRLDLETYTRIARFKAAVADLRRRARVRIDLPAPPSPRLNAAGTGPGLGPAAARVLLIVYSDYQCPFCRNASGWLRRLAEEYPREVRVIHKHFPLTIHPQAFLAARAANCADWQGRFWDYHDRLFAVRDLTEPMLIKYARELGLDELDFEQCLEADASREAVLADLQEARALGLPGTPAFLLNGKQINAQSFDQLKSAVEREIAETAKGGLSQ